MNFAKTFQLLRIRYGLTQEQLIQKTGLSSIGDIETGKREPKISELEAYAKVFGVTVSSLVEFAEQLSDSSVIFPPLFVQNKVTQLKPTSNQAPRMRRTKQSRETS